VVVLLLLLQLVRPPTPENYTVRPASPDRGKY